MRIAKNKAEVSAVIHEFLPYMPRLAGRVDSLDSYIEKLANNAFVVTEGDADFQGFVVFYANDETNRIGFISLIVVKDAYKKCGIGKKLIGYACDIMRKNGMRTVQLMVNKDNDDAIGFYKHIGFSVAEDREDAIGYLMSRSLS